MKNMKTMKTMKTIALLLAVAAAGNSAQAQTAIELPQGRAYTFTGTPASGSGTLSYQWYRNGGAISGATSQNYALPAGSAFGVGVEFKRGTTSSSCSGQVTYSNIYNVSFCGAVINNLCWANENTVSGNQFGTRPDEYSPFWRWNLPAAWASTGGIAGWSTATITAASWDIANTPCYLSPQWRLPTHTEFTNLHNSGYTWADANAKGNAVAGGFYGPNSASCTMSNMAGCIFLPAGGNRSYINGALSGQGTNGYYWTATETADNTIGYALRFYSAGSSPNNELRKATGVNARCVYNP